MKFLEEDDLTALAQGSDESSIIELPDKVDLVDLIEQPAWKSILIELVKKERMDPWEIAISHLAYKYVHRINSF